MEEIQSPLETKGVIKTVLFLQGVQKKEALTAVMAFALLLRIGSTWTALDGMASWIRQTEKQAM